MATTTTHKPTAKAAANKRAAAKVAEVVKTAKPKPQPHPCGCLSQFAYRVVAADIPEADPETFEEYDVFESCGAEVMREFAPGHDAKLKSYLIKCHIEGGEIHYLGQGGGTLNHESAMNMAKRRGWEGFLTKAAERSARQARAKAGRDQAAAERKLAAAAAKVAKASEREAAKAAKLAAVKADRPKAEKAAPKAGGFHPTRAKIGRLVFDVNIESEDVNSLTVSYKDRRGRSCTADIKRSQLVKD